MNLRDEIQRLRNLERQRDAEWETRMREQREASDAVAMSFNRDILPNLRRARPNDYKEWLEGYMLAGGKPTHFYDYNLPSDFYVAIGNFSTMPLYGAQSVNIIVPRHISVTNMNGLGHCNIYFMEDFRMLGSWVPVYNDINF